MAYNVNVPDAFVRMNDSVVQFEIRLVVDGFLEPFPGPGLIVQMNSLKECFALTQSFFRTLAVGDVHHSAGVLDEIARGAENRMTNTVNVPDGATRMHNAI